MKRVALAALVILAGLNEPVLSQNLQQQYNQREGQARSTEEACEKFRAASQYKGLYMGGRFYVKDDKLVYTNTSGDGYSRCNQVTVYFMGKTNCSKGFSKGRSGYLHSGNGRWIPGIEPYYYENCLQFAREGGTIVVYTRNKRWNTAQQLTKNESKRVVLEPTNR